MDCRNSPRLFREYKIMLLLFAEVFDMFEEGFTGPFVFELFGSEGLPFELLI